MTILTSAHRCSVCGGPTVPPSEPITIGGWYGDHHYTWDRGRPYLTSVKCARCRVRDDFTILEMGDGVLLPCRTMVAPNWGRYPTHQAAMDALHAMALEEAQMKRYPDYDDDLGCPPGQTTAVCGLKAGKYKALVAGALELFQRTREVSYSSISAGEHFEVPHTSNGFRYRFSAVVPIHNVGAVALVEET